MNSVSLVGRLTGDPEINDRITCAAFTLAVDRSFKREGEPEADFIRCKLLGDKKADFANRYLRKGMKIGVTGRIQTGSYTNRDGVKVYTTDVIVDNTEFCESKKAGGTQEAEAVGDFMDIPDDMGDELPFN